MTIGKVVGVRIIEINIFTRKLGCHSYSEKILKKILSKN